MSENNQNQNAQSATPTAPTLNAIRNTRIQKLADLADKGINPYPYTYDKNASAKMLQEKYADLPAGEETEDEYLVAGRVMAMRNTGMFIDLMDATGKIQIFSHKENMDVEKFKTLKLTLTFFNLPLNQQVVIKVNINI